MINTTLVQDLTNPLLSDVTTWSTLLQDWYYSMIENALLQDLSKSLLRVTTWLTQHCWKTELSHSCLMCYSMIDTTLLQDLCRQLASGPHRSGSMLTLRDLLRMYNAVVSLLRTSVKMNSPTRAALLGNKVALKAIASLMLLQCDSRWSFVTLGQT